MSLYKSGTISSKIVTAYAIYTCEKCGHTETTKDVEENKKCPKCQEEMKLFSYHAEPDTK